MHFSRRPTSWSAPGRTSRCSAAKGRRWRNCRPLPRNALHRAWTRAESGDLLRARVGVRGSRAGCGGVHRRGGRHGCRGAGGGPRAAAHGERRRDHGRRIRRWPDRGGPGGAGCRGLLAGSGPHRRRRAADRILGRTGARPGGAGRPRPDSEHLQRGRRRLRAARDRLAGRRGSRGGARRDRLPEVVPDRRSDSPIRPRRRGRRSWPSSASASPAGSPGSPRRS